MNMIELKSHYPISSRYIIRENYWIVLMLAVFCYLALSAGTLTNIPALNNLHVTDSRFWILLGGFMSIIILFVKAAYSALYRSTFQYRLEGQRLIIDHGVLLRERGAFPLENITDIYLRRNLIDFILGTSSLEILTPSRDSKRFAQIPGLIKTTAIRLQQVLLSVIEQSRVNHQIVLEPSFSYAQEASRQQELSISN